MKENSREKMMNLIMMLKAVLIDITSDNDGEKIGEGFWEGNRRVNE